MQYGRAHENARFVERFVRPISRDVRATERFVDALEDAALLRPSPRRSAAAPVVRPIVAALRAAAHTRYGAALLQDPVEAREEAARNARLADKEAIVRTSDAVRAQKERDKADRWRRKRRHERVVRLKTLARRLLNS
jgi:hypothetical protein